MAISVATCIEVLGRKYFDFSFKGLDEIGGYMLAGVCAFGFALRAQHALAYARDAAVSLRAGLRAVAFLNVLAMLTLAAMAAFCAWRGGFEVLDVLTSGKHSNTPLSGCRFGCRRRSGWPAWCSSPSARSSWRWHALSLLFRDRALLNRIYGPQSLGGGDFHGDRARRGRAKRINKASRT